MLISIVISATHYTSVFKSFHCCYFSSLHSYFVRWKTKTVSVSVIYVHAHVCLWCDFTLFLAYMTYLTDTVEWCRSALTHTPHHIQYRCSWQDKYICLNLVTTERERESKHRCEYVSPPFQRVFWNWVTALQYAVLMWWQDLLLILIPTRPEGSSCKMCRTKITKSDIIC